MKPFEVADRVREIQTGATGSIVEVTDEFVAVLLDLADLTEEFAPEELVHHNGPPAHAGRPDRAGPPVREGLPGVGDALLSLAEILGAQLPDNPVVQGKLAELKTAVESAMPTTTISDGKGNGWKLCGPGCDLAVARPGKVHCSGAVCGEAIDPGPDPRNPDEIEEQS